MSRETISRFSPTSFRQNWTVLLLLCFDGHFVCDALWECLRVGRIGQLKSQHNVDSIRIYWICRLFRSLCMKRTRQCVWNVSEVNNIILSTGYPAFLVTETTGTWCKNNISNAINGGRLPDACNLQSAEVELFLFLFHGPCCLSQNKMK